eukprot:gnl/TRDRNA2_/TRDRNA2_173773_c3_seq4.p1 gnl/TRDRNA2_/TRDRNA2_173773_c3~~gnl/TRDRNA2_/TRDRNA2_173773_c3_seq4.p1  ORF type:complete len:398 (+),score=68.62 gnl/TRDRNA2_/TRDRNA2_173773_c3_seq4:174-1196(+)
MHSTVEKWQPFCDAAKRWMSKAKERTAQVAGVLQDKAVPQQAAQKARRRLIGKKARTLPPEVTNTDADVEVVEDPPLPPEAEGLCAACGTNPGCISAGQVFVCGDCFKDDTPIQPQKERPRRPPPATGAAEGACCACGGRHALVKCPFIPPGFWKKASNKAKEAALRPAHGTEHVLFVPQKDAKVVPVPGDGNCFFAACSQSLAMQRPDGSAPGAAAIRSAVIKRIVSRQGDELNGMPLREWVRQERQMSVQEYGKRMAKFSVDRDDTWGGALEAAVVALVYDCGLSTFERVKGGFERVADQLPPNPASETHLCILWTGNHYNALQMSLPGRSGHACGSA